MTRIFLPARLFRAMPDMAGEDWCLELRDGDSRVALWWVMEQGIRPIPLEIPAKDSWNLTLLDFYGGISVLGRYSPGGMPVLQGIEAVDQTGRQIWHHPEGKSIRRTETEWEVTWKGEIRREPVPKMNFTPPDWLSPHLGSLPESFRSVLAPIHPNGVLLDQVERVDFGELTLLSCFFRENDAKLSQYFAVLRPDQNLYFSDCIQQNLNGFSLDTWSVRGGKVFLMKNHQEWCVIDLQDKGKFPF